MKIFRLSYFLGPYSPGDTQSTALTTLKQCLHFDPDSSQCLPAHRLVKSLNKSFKKLEKSMEKEDWAAVSDQLSGKTGFIASYESALEQHTSRAALGLPPAIPLPSAKRTSPRRAALLKAICRSYMKKNDAGRGERWCNALLEMEGMEDDSDALIVRADALLAKEEWEEAVRVLERAFEASGRSNREIHQRLQKAQRLLKQSRQKDYYKVLGVSRSADAKEIKKALCVAPFSRSLVRVPGADLRLQPERRPESASRQGRQRGKDGRGQRGVRSAQQPRYVPCLSSPSPV